MKWLTIIQQIIRDLFGLGFGAWIIYKQVEAVNPNIFLGLLGFGIMVPAAAAAVMSILSGPFVSSSSSQQQPVQSSPSSSQGANGEQGS